MTTEFDKQQYRRGRRRRMDKFRLGEVSFVDTPAQGPALAQIIKTDSELQDMSVDALLFEKQGPRPGETFRQFLARMREEDENMSEADARRMFNGGGGGNDANKRGDMVDLVTSSDMGHQHGVSIHTMGHDEAVIMVHYASGEEGEMHDHQIVRNDDGTYMMTENRGHTHTLDEGMLNRMLADMVLKQGPSRAVRDRLAESGEALPDGSFPIRNGTDLNNAIQAFGRANEDDRRRVANHIRRRARALNLTDRLPEEGVLADLLKANDPTDKRKESTMSDVTKKANERLTALEAENALLKKVSALSAVHKAHYDSLDETLDDTARAEFLDMSVEKRDEAVAKAEATRTDADPVVYTAVDGTEYRKSDDVRLVNMAKKYDADHKKSVALAKAAEDASLTKRAETDLVNFPGDVDVRKAILKAVDGIDDEAIRGKAHDALKAQNAKMHGAFETVGTAAAPDVEKSANTRKSAEAELDRLTDEMVAKDGGSRVDAYMKVADANPKLYAKAVGG